MDRGKVNCCSSQHGPPRFADTFFVRNLRVSDGTPTTRICERRLSLEFGPEIRDLQKVLVSWVGDKDGAEESRANNADLRKKAFVELRIWT
jgi:hypothetical protein